MFNFRVLPHSEQANVIFLIAPCTFEEYFKKLRDSMAAEASRKEPNIMNLVKEFPEAARPLELIARMVGGDRILHVGQASEDFGKGTFSFRMSFARMRSERPLVGEEGVFDASDLSSASPLVPEESGLRDEDIRPATCSTSDLEH